MFGITSIEIVLMDGISRELLSQDVLYCTAGFPGCLTFFHRTSRQNKTKKMLILETQKLNLELLCLLPAAKSKMGHAFGVFTCAVVSLEIDDPVRL